MKIHNILLFILIIFWIGMITVLLMTTVSYNHTYEAERLPSKTGQILGSDDASGKFYRFSPSNESGFIVFGPYVKIPEGNYLASFRLKTDVRSISEPVATLDVFSSDIGKINETKIYAKDFKDLNLYQSFVLPFKSNGKGKFEFRVNKSIDNNLLVDSIIISPSDNFSVYKSAFIQIMKIVIFMITGLSIIAIIRKSKTGIVEPIKKYFHFSIKVEVLLFIFILFVYTIKVLGLIGEVHIPTGDEPHYLITTHSIVKDGDIYLENNYLNEDYKIFYPHSIITHISPNIDGKWLPAHEIGLSILLAIPYFLLGLFGARLALAIIATILVVNIFLLIKDLLGDKIALIVSLSAALTPPLLFYSHSIYPETTAALILVYSTRILYKTYNKESIPTSRYVLCGILIAFLPWLGIKYLSLMLPLILLFLLYNKNYTINFKVLSPIILSLFLYMVFMFRMFGSLSPSSRYGVDLGKHLSFGSPLSLSRIAYYFVDQQVGLFIYTPIYILCIIGLIVFIRNSISKERFDIFLLILLPSILYFLMNVTAGTTGGFSPPSRPLVAILPPITLLFGIGLSFFSLKRLQLVIDSLYILSIGIIFIILKNPSLMFNYNDKKTDIFQALFGKSNFLNYITDSPFIDLTKIFPSFLIKNSLDNMICILSWFGIFTIFVIIEYIYRLNKERIKLDNKNK